MSGDAREPGDGANLFGQHEGSTPSEPSRTGADQVHSALRSAILMGKLKPGSSFSQVQLARELGVSRTPLREAVRMLQREGLISGEANRMVRVAPLSIEDIEELYALRVANEAMAIRLSVPRMTAEDDEFVSFCLSQMGRPEVRAEPETWDRHHRAFHTRLVARSGRRMTTLLSELYDYSQRYRWLYIRSDPRALTAGTQEHEAIVAACLDREAALAGVLLARHLTRTALSVLLQLAPEHDPRLVRETLRAVLDGSGAADDAVRLAGVGMLSELV